MNRLLSDDFNGNRRFLSKMIGDNIEDLTVIRPHVFRLLSKSGCYILKGFSYQRQLNLQINLTAALHNEGFPYVNQFVQLADEQYFFWDEGKYWAVMPAIKKGRIFAYSKSIDRQAGAKLLGEFHKAVQTLPIEMKNDFPVYSLLKKWSERLFAFNQQTEILRLYLSAPSIQQLLEWGWWSLQELTVAPITQLEKQAREYCQLIHGDTAEHNFIRSVSDHLYLIDFDLAAVAPVEYEYLQYANRLLPHLEWSLNELYEIEPFPQLLQNQWFLNALVFPTDIYREWNRFIRGKGSKERAKQLQQWTLTELKVRKLFVENIRAMIRS